MSDTLEESNTTSSVGLKQQCVKYLKSPNFIKTIVITTCVLLLVQQISSCIQKLVDKPITTYTHFDYNKTITYPSITFCREPPYIEDKLVEYGLYSHPRYTSTWKTFNFTNISLDKLWEEITYTDDDFFVQYGLDNLRENVAVTSTMAFVDGRCYTLSPKVMDIKAKATQEYGYSITLQHFASDMESPTSIIPPGYHVYVHYVREPYTEVEVYNGGLVDYLYINTGETVKVKLKVDEYVMISNAEDPCTNAVNYSANKCTTQYVTELVVKQVGCSGPWMNSNLPYCDNYEDMRSLISTYMHFYQNHECNICPRFCRSLLYNAFVTDRQKYYMWNSQGSQRYKRSTDATLQTTIYFHFNNMMVSVYEEKYNYDWNVFLSDLGGSVMAKFWNKENPKETFRRVFHRIVGISMTILAVLSISIVEELWGMELLNSPKYIQSKGFLLGLSVIGLLNIIGYVWVYFIGPLICNRNNKDNTVYNSQTISSGDVSTITQSEYFRKCDRMK